MIALHFFDLANAAFQFDGFSSGFHESARIHDRFFGGGVGVDGQVAEEEGVLATAGGGGGVVQHVLHGDVSGVGKSQHHHPQ